MNKQEIKIKSSDGIHDLSAVIYKPEGEIKGIFHIVHGMTEHIGRYDELMQTICENGYLVAGYDNLGHGKTAEPNKDFGYIAKKDGYKYLVRDVSVFAKYLKEQFGDVPYFLMGHSMGSFIVRLAAEKFPGTFDKLIICGTGGPQKLSKLGLVLINIMKVFCGDKYVSKLIDNMAFASYNKRFENTEGNWLTKDGERVKKYKSDPFCQFRFTLSAMHDLLTLSSLSNRKEWFLSLDKSLPILIVSGADDPVGDYGIGVKRVFDRLNATEHNVKIRLYENCRHEIHNDSCSKEMLDDILNFIK